MTDAAAGGYDAARVNAAVDIVQLVSRYAALKREGAEYSALCPFHDDTSPPGNLKVNPAKQLWVCFACRADEQYGSDAIGFFRTIEGVGFREACERLTNGSGTLPPARAPDPAKLKKAPPRENLPAPEGDVPDMATERLGAPSATWTYRNAEGAVLGYVARYETDAGKQVRCWTYGRYAEADPPRWECKHWQPPRPIYGLDLLAARPTAQVLVVEGEKACDAARLLMPGMVSVTWPGGAGAVRHIDWTPLHGRKLVLWPDADEPGRQAMARIAALLDGHAAEIKGIDPDTQPDGTPTPEGWDAADAVGWTPADALAWAKARITVYVAPQQEPEQPAPETPTIAQDELSTGSPTETCPTPEIAATAEIMPNPAVSEAQDPTDSQPPAEFPSEATVTRPPKGRKPRLAAVEGNTVRVQEIEPEPEQLPAFSEFALADSFVAGIGEDWRYTAAWGMWFRWTGVRWQEDKTKQITWDVTRCCRKACREHASESTPSQRMKITTLRTVNAVAGLASANPRVAVCADAWNADPWLLGLPDGGVVDLRTGKTTESDRTAMVNKAVSVMPVAGETPLFDSILAHAAKGDPSMVAYLWRWFGYMLTGDTREQALLFFYGPGASGKTTLIRVLAEIAGDYRKNVPMEAFIARDHSEHPTEIAMLAGARIVTATEPDSGTRWNEGRIKALTGGEVITARVMRGDPFQFMPTWKIVIGGNHKPALRSVGEEFKRRFHFVLTETIPEEHRIRNLHESLRAEYPAILARMIRGCLEWQDYGLGKPQPVEDAVSDYLEGQDTFGEWFEARAEQRLHAITSSAALYNDYTAWAKESGYYVPARNTFSGWLEDRGYARTKTGNVRSFKGIALRASGFTSPA